MDYQEERVLDDVFDDLIIYLNEHNSKLAESLNTPATSNDIDKLEKKIGTSIPNEVQGLYLLVNGQENKEIALYPDGYEFLTLDEIAQQWQMLKRIHENNSGFWPDDGKTTETAILNVWWTPEWIPFAQNAAGDFLCVDLKPGDSGTKGQVIEFIHDDTYRYHHGFSIVDFLGEFEQGLRSGKYVYHEEWKTYIKSSSIDQK